MNKLLKFGFAAIALMFVFSVIAMTETKAQGLTNDILKRMDAYNKALTSLQANVKMDKYNSQLDEHDLMTGTTKYLTQKKDKPLVRIDWTSPVEESLAVIKGNYVLYRPRLKQAIVGNVDSAKSKNRGANNALAFMNMSKAQLQDNYNISYVGQEGITGSVQTWHLLLTPKTAQNYKFADLWVNSDGLPLQAKVTENNGDSTTILLSGVQENKLKDTKVFVINPAKGTQIIQG